MQLTTITAALLLFTAAHASAEVKISALKPLTLRDGPNLVPMFMPSGASATIIQAWRENGNAHSYHDWLVLAPATKDFRAGVVGIDRGCKGLEDVIRDEPFDGERVLGSIKFARGRVDGKPASLILEATLDEPPSHVLADHASATVRVFKLVATEGAPGDTPFEFVPVLTLHPTKRYCNAELALSQGLKVPLGSTYEGLNRQDGCYPNP